MKVGITGAQSVGKTTLLNALRSEKKFKQYAICDEVTRELIKLGLDINEAGSDLTQELIMQQHVFNAFMYNDMLTDRTALDGLVYTTYLHLHGKVSSDTLERVRTIYDKIIHEYDYIFYIPPEFNIVDDGVRSIDPTFRDQIVELFEGYITEMPREIVRLSGSVRERLDQIMKVLK